MAFKFVTGTWQTEHTFSSAGGDGNVPSCCRRISVASHSPLIGDAHSACRQLSGKRHVVQRYLSIPKMAISSSTASVAVCFSASCPLSVQRRITVPAAHHLTSMTLEWSHYFLRAATDDCSCGCARSFNVYMVYYQITLRPDPSRTRRLECLYIYQSSGHLAAHAYSIDTIDIRSCHVNSPCACKKSDAW